MTHPYLICLHREKTLAIIGTAGRRDDADKLTWEHWLQMLMATQEVIDKERVTRLVSGGAAWADHAAVAFADDYPVKLYLPENERDLSTAQYYQDKFTRTLNRGGTLIRHDTWRDVLAVADITYHGGFKDRNSLVARDADVFLAMTFGDGPNVKDGGTADTVRKMRAQAIPGWHFDLNTFTLHAL